MVEFYFLCICIIILILGFLFGFKEPKRSYTSNKYRLNVQFKDDYEDCIDEVSLGDFETLKEAIEYSKKALKGEDSEIMNYCSIEIIDLKDNTLVYKEYK